MGSFIMFNPRAHPGRSPNGSVSMSLDVLDFSVIHLSAFERLQRRWATSIGVANMKVGDIEPVHRSIGLLKARALQAEKNRQVGMTDPIADAYTQSIQGQHQHQNQRVTGGIPPLHTRLNRTVAIMPWLGGEMGAGHSDLNNRYFYLEACFWSLYAMFPHVVVTVKTEKDRNHCLHDSKLPFYAVHLLLDLPKNAALPVATVQHTKALMSPGGMWESMFDHMYFTESDQIIMFKPQVAIDSYVLLDKYPRRLILPHRLMPYPDPVLTLFHKRKRVDDVSEKNIRDLQRDLAQTQAQSSQLQSQAQAQAKAAAAVKLVSLDVLSNPWGWERLSCCIERQNCMDRKAWRSVKNHTVPILPLLGMRTPLGNSNFHAESYRTCTLTAYVDTCP